jgi:hypothetical protein
LHSGLPLPWLRSQLRAGKPPSFFTPPWLHTDCYKESFYSKLKKFSDECNTNLYVSNIPKNFNEHELAGIFAPHKVCSSRILRDASGTGRGVGFAR